MMTARVMGVLTVLAASAVFAMNARAEEGKAPLTDKEFIQKAAEMNMAETQLAKYAETQTGNDKVRGFSQGIQRDHKKAQDQLKRVLTEGTTLPDELSEKGRQDLERVKKLEGQEFDREYMKFMQESHRKAIDLYERQAKSGTNPELKRYAEDTLKVLRTHLDEAQKTAKAIDDE